MMKEYKKETVSITWEAEKCIHSGKCARGLSSVFKPREKPWIQVGGASEQEIIDQVSQCPSGALGIKR